MGIKKYTAAHHKAGFNLLDLEGINIDVILLSQFHPEQEFTNQMPSLLNHENCRHLESVLQLE